MVQNHSQVVLSDILNLWAVEGQREIVVKCCQQECYCDNVQAGDWWGRRAPV